jgi:hypothetical protein
MGVGDQPGGEITSKSNDQLLHRKIQDSISGSYISGELYANCKIINKTKLLKRDGFQGIPIGMVLIVMMNAFVLNLMLCGNGSLLGVVRCQGQGLSGSEMGIVHQINHKMGEIKKEVIVEVLQ